MKSWRFEHYIMCINHESYIHSIYIYSVGNFAESSSIAVINENRKKSGQ